MSTPQRFRLVFVTDTLMKAGRALFVTDVKATKVHFASTHARRWRARHRDEGFLDDGQSHLWSMTWPTFSERHTSGPR